MQCTSRPSPPRPRVRNLERRRRALFHPDFDRRLRNCTESADPDSEETGARGLMRSLAITAGGEFHPALRTPAPGLPRSRIMILPTCTRGQARMEGPRATGEGSLAKRKLSVSQSLLHRDRRKILEPVLDLGEGRDRLHGAARRPSDVSAADQEKQQSPGCRASGERRGRRWKGVLRLARGFFFLVDR